MVIKWKNILNRGNKTDRAPAPAACPAGGRLRAAAGLTAFLLGISLLLAGGLGQYGWWSTELGARWARDSLEEDWQDTAAFRTIICNWLDACLTAGTWEYTSGGDYGKELLDGLEGDKNLLYAVARRGSVLYTNTSDGGFLSSGQPPEGYRFALRCEDGMVSITQDGRELDVYGDGWYTEDDLWFVPGYENFPMDADARNIQVYLAAASDPKPMVYGNYLGSGADIRTSQLYDLVQNLAQYRRELLTEWGMLGGGVLLLALALVLRRDKARAEPLPGPGDRPDLVRGQGAPGLSGAAPPPLGGVEQLVLRNTRCVLYSGLFHRQQRLRTVGHGGRRPLFLQRGCGSVPGRDPCVWNGGRARTCSSISFRRWAPVPPPLFWPSWRCTC